MGTGSTSLALLGASGRWCARLLVAGAIAFGLLLGIGSGAGLALAAAGGTTLESVDFATLPGDRAQIRLRLSGPAPEPASFTIDNPARIALDLPGVHNGLARQTQAIGVGVARSMNVVEAQGRTRVVLNLTQLARYEVRREGNDLYVVLGGAGSARATPGVSKAAARPSPARARAGERRVVGIDFRRGDQGAGKVVVTLSDPGMVTDVHQEGAHIVVDFLDATLPAELQRRLDVTDFATPIQSVETTARGKKVRMAIAATGDYEQLAYQVDRVLTVEVRPLTRQEKERKQKEEFNYTGERLSLNFQDIEVRAVLQLIADFTGLNLVAADTVQGSVTLRLQNVPWDQALDLVLKTKGLDKRQVGNVILVAPAEEIAAREKLELETQQQVSELAPLRSDLVQVNYAKAADLAALLKAKENSLLSARGNVAIDERTNTLLVQDTADKLEEVRKLVARLDVPVRQVLIESRVVIASSDFGKELGVRWGMSRDSAGGGKPSTGDSFYLSGSLNGTTQLINNETLQFNDRLNVNLPVSVLGAAAGRFGIALAKLPLGTLLELELSALQTEGRGEVLSNPRVITSNQKEAMIEAGTEIPYQEATSSGATSVSFKKAVLSLKVTPQITPDDHIIMDLTVNKDLPVFDPRFPVPAIDTKEVSTQVLVDNGETVVLGGIYEQDRSSGLKKVPLLGDLPYLGWLFRTRFDKDEKTELLVFVTPKIVKDSMALR